MHLSDEGGLPSGSFDLADALQQLPRALDAAVLACHHGGGRRLYSGGQPLVQWDQQHNHSHSRNESKLDLQVNMQSSLTHD